MSREPELAITAAFPGDTAPHRVARLALLRLYHAGERCLWSVSDMDTRIAALIDDPVEGIFDGLLIDDSLSFALRLEGLARECRKAATALTSIRTEWQQFDSLGRARDGRLRQPDHPSVGQRGSDDECPF